MNELKRHSIDQQQQQASSTLYEGPILSQSLQSLSLEGGVSALEDPDTMVAKQSSQSIHNITSTLVDVANTYTNGNKKKHRGRSILSNSISSTTQNLMDLASSYCNLLHRMHTIQQINTIWQRRYRYLQTVLLDLRPVNGDEGNGQYLTSLFPLLDMVQNLRTKIDSQQDLEHQDDGFFEDEVFAPEKEHAANQEEIATVGSQSRHSTRPDQLVPGLEWNELVGGDEDLQLIMEPFRGTEANYISAIQSIAVQEFTERYLQQQHQLEDDKKAVEHEDRDQNMLAWALLKVRAVLEQ